MVDAKMLQRYSMFGGLLEDQIDVIIPMMEKNNYACGDVIIVEGTPNDKVFFIIEGKVSIVKEGKVLYEMTQGDTFGEMEVLDVMPCTATVRADTDVAVMSISNKSLREIYKNDIKSYSLLIMNLARDISRRLRAANDVMVDGKH